MKILLIAKGDYKLIYEFVQKIYFIGHYIIKVVYSPADAVLAMRETSPDLVIIDMDFTLEMEQAIVFDQINSFHNIPVIFSVSTKVTDIFNTTLSIKPFAYISYSCSMDELEKVLAEAFENIDLIEKTTRQSDMLNTMMNSSTTGIVILDFKGNIKKHNRIFFDILQTVPSLENINSLAGGKLDMSTVLKVLHSTKQDVLSIDINGETKYLHISADTCEWYKTTLILLIVNDLTQIYRVRTSLTQSENRFTKVFSERMEPGVIVKCGTCEIIAANNAFIELYKIRGNDCVGKNLPVFLGPDVVSLMQSSAANKSSFQVNKIEQKNGKGESFIVNIRGKKLIFDSEDYYLLDIRDITEQLKTEESKHMMQQQLLHANKMTALGTLVSCVAHEINNPNNFIMFNTSLITDYLEMIMGSERDKMTPEDLAEAKADIQELISGIAKGSERIKGIVDDLRGFCRTGDTSVFQKIDLKPVIETSVRILSHKISKTTNRFSVFISESDLCIYGNQQRLEQVVMNIMVNALEAINSADSRLEINCYDDENNVILKVKDQGSGISEENMENIFNPFFSTKYPKGGTGLGLYIANNIIKEHSGELHIDSQESVGTTVTIKFPKYKYD